MKNLFINKLLPGLTIILSVVFISLFPMQGCSNEDSISFIPPTFDEHYNDITYPGNTYSEVVFKHKDHNDREGGVCIKCHNCDTTQMNENWNCRSCHSPLDAESRCNSVDDDHGCTYVQCDYCHNVLQANPGRDCLYCHPGGMLVDNTPPTVNPVLEKINNSYVKITFSEVVDQITAEDRFNYAMSLAGAPPVTPWNAEIKNNVEVELNRSIGGVTSGQTIVVTVTGVKDIAGNEIEDTNVATYTVP